MARARTSSLIRTIVGCVAVGGFVTAGTVATKDVFTPAQKNHWAFKKVTRPTRHRWSRIALGGANPIGAFVMSKLEAAGVPASPPADKITLLRRVTFDLIGLPPTPEEVRAFLAEDALNAYEKVVDRLLASPHYGERWARHWLDLARYAESEGFKADETRPNAWRYRDYVIKSFNDNKPYDRFVQEQIAGDELWPNSPDARVATAFNRNYPDESNARCHNHKFDPILQADYYRLQAFYANTAADDQITLESDEKVREHQAAMAVWDSKTKPIRDEIAALLDPEKQLIIKDVVDKYPRDPGRDPQVASRPESLRVADVLQSRAVSRGGR
jgi:hypothetical protein